MASAAVAGQSQPLKLSKPDVTTPRWEEHAQAVTESVEISDARLTEIFQHLRKLINSKSAETASPTTTTVPAELIHLKTYLNFIPKGKESGAGYAICLCPTRVVAQRVGFNNGTMYPGKAFIAEYIEDAANENATSDHAPVLHDPQVTASDVVAATYKCIRQVLAEENEGLANTGTTKSSPLPVVISSFYNLEMKRLNCAEFRNFHAKCPTLNEDPLEAADIASLLQVGLERNGIFIKVVGLCSESTALLLAGSYERPPRQNRCLLSVLADGALRAAYVEPKPKELGLEHSIVEVDLAYFRGTYINAADSYKTESMVPRTSADYQMDFMACISPEFYEVERLDRMVSGQHLPELCRMLAVQALRERAPEAMFQPGTFSFKAVMAVLEADDDRAVLDVSRKVLERLWGFHNASDSEARVFHSVTTAVFRRSAAIVAALISALSLRTGRLQAALGGVTVALSGATTGNSRYQALIRENLNRLFGKDTSRLLQFQSVEDISSAKGAALLNWAVQNDLC